MIVEDNYIDNIFKLLKRSDTVIDNLSKVLKTEYNMRQAMASKSIFENDENHKPNLVKPCLIDFMTLDQDLTNKTINDIKVEHEAEIQKLKFDYESKLKKYEDELQEQLQKTKIEYQGILQSELEKSSKEYNTELSKVIDINQKKDEHINQLIEALESKRSESPLSKNNIHTFRGHQKSENEVYKENKSDTSCQVELIEQVNMNFNDQIEHVKSQMKHDEEQRYK